MALSIGVLSFHGDVVEHLEATQKAAKKLKVAAQVIPVRTKEALKALTALVIPGGESTTLHKLCAREHMWDDMKTLPFMFGTCAGAIMLADDVCHKAEGQETLERMHMSIDRNAYGRQTDSFEEPLDTELGTISAVYIRAPKILKVYQGVRVLAKRGDDIVACEEIDTSRYSMATCFHPELTTTVFHEYFIKQILNGQR